MTNRDEMAYQAALMHYVQGHTMESIARNLKVSRSTVSRLIQKARQEGYIQFNLNPPAGETPALRQKISQLYGINVQVVPVAHNANINRRLHAVAAVAGNMISDTISPHTTIGIAWGNTLSAISEHLIPKPVNGVTVVQMNGAASTSNSGILYVGTLMEAFGTAYQAHVQHFPVPAFFDYPDTKAALWRERSIKAVLELQKQIDLAIFGVGTVEREQLSMVYSGGYFSPKQVAEIRELGVVGDVCTVLLRQDGSWEDLEINQRGTGPTPKDLQQIPQRICVASGAGKASPLLAALRAGVATELVIDQDCAVQLLKLSKK